MNEAVEYKRILGELCADQSLAVLATDTGSGPYTSLVAFAATADQRQFFFATPFKSNKWKNIAGNPRVSLLVDNRSNQVNDFHLAAAATILGIAEELKGAERESGVSLYLLRHPHLADFIKAPDTALFRVQVNCIYLVTRFQEVREFHFLPCPGSFSLPPES